jgi:hypothetical protein
LEQVLVLDVAVYTADELTVAPLAGLLTVTLADAKVERKKRVGRTANRFFK